MTEIDQPDDGPKYAWTESPPNPLTRGDIIAFVVALALGIGLPLVGIATSPFVTCMLGGKSKSVCETQFIEAYHAAHPEAAPENDPETTGLAGFWARR